MDVLGRAKALLSGQKLAVVFPEGDDERIVKAASILRDGASGVAPILLGPKSAISATASKVGVTLKDLTVIDPKDNPDQDMLAQAYGKARPDTGHALALRFVRKPLFCAGMMVHNGLAHALVAGVTCPTARVIESALMTIGLSDSVAKPSSCFLMELANPNRHILFADCAVNVDPSMEELADIGIASAHTMKILTGLEPKVAFLSFSTLGSAHHALADKVGKAARLARERCPQFPFEGELQADAALSPRVASLKLKSASQVAGQANVLIFPDLNAANIGYKLVQYLGGASALGPFLQGFAKPVSDLSRGASVDDIVATAILTAVQALKA